MQQQCGSYVYNFTLKKEGNLAQVGDTKNLKWKVTKMLVDNALSAYKYKNKTEN